MNVADVLDSSFAVLRANLRTIAIILGVVVVPIRFVAALATRHQLGTSVFGGFRSSTTTAGHSTTSLHVTSSSWASLVASIVIVPLCAGAIAAVVAGSYADREVSAAGALRAAAGRWLPLLVASVLVHVLEAAAFLVLVLPGLLVMALCVSVAPAIVIERLGPLRGIRRAWALDGPRVWGVLGVALLSGLVFGVCGGMVSWPLTVAGAAAGPAWGWALQFVGAVVSSVFTVALTAASAALIYFDGRIRVEGFDLEVLAGRLAD